MTLEPPKLVQANNATADLCLQG